MWARVCWTYRRPEVVVSVSWGVGGRGREVRTGRARGQVRSRPSSAGGQVGGGGEERGRPGTPWVDPGGFHAGGARGRGRGAAPPTRLGRGGGTRVTLQNTEQKQTKQNEGWVHNTSQRKKKKTLRAGQPRSREAHTLQVSQ